MRCRFFSIAAIALSLCAFCSASSSARDFPRDYDRQIKAAASRYMPLVDWRLYKAQLWQESRLDPTATSPVGAGGIAQFMHGTWDEAAKALQLDPLGRYEARQAILAGAWYMGRLRGQWTAERPEKDRHSLAMASYNAGLGNVLKAQRLCGGKPLYDEIIVCLKLVTGRHSAETVTYVDRIYRWHAQMLRGY